MFKSRRLMFVCWSQGLLQRAAQSGPVIGNPLNPYIFLSNTAHYTVALQLIHVVVGII